MLTGYADVFDKIKEYSGFGSIVILFLCAVLFLWMSREKERVTKIYLVYFALMLVAVFNPVTILVLEKTNNLSVFERFLWLLISPVLLSALSGRIAHQKKLLLVASSVLVILCGRTVYTDIEFAKAENVCKIQSEAIEVSDIIMRDFEGLPETARVIPNRRGFDDGCRPKAAITEPLCEDVRMYNANIDLWYVRSQFGNAKKKKYQKVAGWLSQSCSEIPVKKLLKRMRKHGFRYLVLGDWQTLTGNVGKYDLVQIGQTEHYRVIRYTPRSEVKVSHFSGQEDLGCMSYLLETYDGELIVVDGGRASMSLDLTERIKEKGGRVGAWIITHPHDDHAGVLASILEAEWDKSQILIDRIYIGDWDWDAVNEQGIRTDFVYYLRKNLEMRDNVTVLKKGDLVKVCGMNLRVLHTCNEEVTEGSDNIINDGSMVFLLNSSCQGMLFLGDIGDNNPQIRSDEGITDDKISRGSKMGRSIAKEVQKALKENKKQIVAVQMAHHGNSLLPDSFYESIAPEVAFFDAPDWLMENRDPSTGEKSYYTTEHYRRLMEENGARIITFSDNAQITLW